MAEFPKRFGEINDIEMTCGFVCGLYPTFIVGAYRGKAVSLSKQTNFLSRSKQVNLRVNTFRKQCAQQSVPR